MRHLLMFVIRIYQATLSYDHGLMGKIFPNTRYCRFTPTCSEYAYEAIKKYGTIKGVKMALNRLNRCSIHTPMGTYDPVK